MIQSKEEFIKSFLPDEVEKIELTQINMDITDLGLADILRNLNKLYPYNTRSRNAIISGKTVVGVLCRTDTLSPLCWSFNRQIWNDGYKLFSSLPFWEDYEIRRWN